MTNISNQEKIIQILLEQGQKLLEEPRESVMKFSGDRDADALLNDLEGSPHAFVLACVMDRQIKAERAWRIPYEISKEIGGFDFPRLLQLTDGQITTLFKNKSLHRFNEQMARYFHRAVQRIHSDYGDNAGKIWSGKPSSATVVGRLLEFDGIGIKIATMAANILVRDFKIPMSDHTSIDISPDIHTPKVFRRAGLVHKDATNERVIYRAK